MRWNDPKLSFTRPIRWLLALLGRRRRAGRGVDAGRRAGPPACTAPPPQPVVEVAVGRDVPGAARRCTASWPTPRTGATLIVDGGAASSAERRRPDRRRRRGRPGRPRSPTWSSSRRRCSARSTSGYLELPGAVLTTVMRKHQRYLPVRDADGALLPHFVTVANGPVDADAGPRRQRGGAAGPLRGRGVLLARRPRDAARGRCSAGWRRLTFTDKLGSMADRADRIAALAPALADASARRRRPRRRWTGPAELAKFDLGSQMVTEMTSLAGMMARDYARTRGETAEVAQALYETELPRSAGDALPSSAPGALLSLADRLDLLAGLFAIGAEPTGSTDPFASAACRCWVWSRSCASVPGPAGDHAAAGACRRAESVPRASRYRRRHWRRPGVRRAALRAGSCSTRATSTTRSCRRCCRWHGCRCWPTRRWRSCSSSSAGTEFADLVAALQRVRRIVPATDRGVVRRARC